MGKDGARDRLGLGCWQLVVAMKVTHLTAHQSRVVLPAAGARGTSDEAIGLQKLSTGCRHQ